MKERMKLNSHKVIKIMCLCISLGWGGVWEVRKAVANEFLSTNNQAAVLAAAAKQCPNNLSFLQPKMEKALQFIKSATFKKAILSSLHVSIPEAIVQSDGLAQQIAFLKREIDTQEQERVHAEQVAREGLPDSSQPLKPCRRRKESGYCYAMDQYLASTAANLANREFLKALECYQHLGVR